MSTAPMPLQDADVHLWIGVADASLDDTLLARYRALLTPQEYAQADRFAFARDTRRYLLTRALARTVLSMYAPVDPVDWVFRTNAYGCPFVANDLGGRTLRFNLSHTDTLVAMAVTAGREVGMDVEKPDRAARTDIAHHFFSPREVAGLLALPPDAQPHRFMELWTFKESYIKARAMGLSIPLDRFGFEMPSERGVEIFFDPEWDDRPADWQFFQLRPVPDHLMALCVQQLSGQPPPVLTLRRTLPLHPGPFEPLPCVPTRASADR